MKVEIDFESVQKLRNGDCVEINGMVGEKKLMIEFFIKDSPSFRCSLDYKYGWDVYIITDSVREIQSGTIFTSLEYFPNFSFSIRFNISSNIITTLLNEIVLCTAEHGQSVDDITSIRISGDSPIKHILFSDYSSKSSRVLQPVIYQSLEPNKDGGDNQVTVIESRRRIVFKSEKNESDTLLSDEYDSDSDPGYFKNIEINSDFDYLKKVLLTKSTSDSEEFSPHYQGAVPQNKYVISYFDPDLISDGNYGDENDQRKARPKYEFYEKVNENMLESTTRINVLKTNTERIGQSIENTGLEIAKIRRPSTIELDDSHRLKVPTMLAIPVGEMNGSYYKYNLTKDLSRASKIPVLKRSSNHAEKNTENIVNRQTYGKHQNTQGKASLDRKSITPQRMRKQHVIKK